MVSRIAPIENYWTEFDLGAEDLEFIYNLLLDREVPLTTHEMALALVGDRLHRKTEEVAGPAEPSLTGYLPSMSFEPGQKLAFPALGNQVGEVIGTRAGGNPDLGSFDVIRVQFAGAAQPREFAARLNGHLLNAPLAPADPPEKAATPETVLERYNAQIEAGLVDRLSRAPDIVRIAGRWFPKALLADVNVGHLNIAEAVLDVAAGGPLPPEELLKHVGLASDMDPLLAEFSLDYAMQEDERFDEVGPAGKVLWYLRRLEPPEVHFMPPRLEVTPHSADRSRLTPPLLALERELDDEHSPLEPPAAPPEAVTLALLFPHWRVGTLPLSWRLRPLFPTAYEAPRIRFMLVDGHSGEKFPGWVVREQRYVHGLEDWYRRYDVLAGGLIRVRPGEMPGEVVVEAADRRRRNDWIRTVAIDGDGRIGFTMLKQPIGVSYDDLMIVGLADRKALDEAWLRGADRRMSIEKLVAHVFRELARLNPQSAVHAQSLYSGVNVIQRLPPAPIFAELVSRDYFVHVGDLYWRFDEAAWSSA